MAALEKGNTRNGEGYQGKTWNILGQIYFPKAVTDSTFAFETNSDPGQFVPVHIHPTQDEFILVQEGVLDQFTKPSLVACDTMNHWIQGARDPLPVSGARIAFADGTPLTVDPALPPLEPASSGLILIRLSTTTD